MTDEASLRRWVSENSRHVWSLLNSQACRRLPYGFVEYLSPLSEEQLDILAEELPELHRGYILAARHRQRYAQHRAMEGKQHLIKADEYLKGLIEVCGRTAVDHAYIGSYLAWQPGTSSLKSFVKLRFAQRSAHSLQCHLV